MPDDLSVSLNTKLDRASKKIQAIRDSNFKQQIFNVYRPKLNTKNIIMQFVGLGTLCLVIGSYIISQSNSVVEYITRYDVDCHDKLHLEQSLCNIDIKIDKDIVGPVYVYYELKEFYQNHRTYVKSRSYKQTKGNYLAPEQLTDCDPIILVSDMHEYQKTSLSKKTLDDSWPAIPCGLIAKSYFNDTFQLYNKADGANITIDDSQIAWTSDVDVKFKNIKQETIPDSLNTKDWRDLQWIDMTNQHFIVWMRTAALPNFRKLYGKVQDGLKAGKYTLKVQNNFDVSTFQGEKAFVLATVTSLGGKNDFLGTAFIVVGLVSLLYVIGFIIVFKKKKAQ